MGYGVWNAVCGMPYVVGVCGFPLAKSLWLYMYVYVHMCMLLCYTSSYRQWFSLALRGQNFHVHDIAQETFMQTDEDRKKGDLFSKAQKRKKVRRNSIKAGERARHLQGRDIKARK